MSLRILILFAILMSWGCASSVSRPKVEHKPDTTIQEDDLLEEHPGKSALDNLPASPYPQSDTQGGSTTTTADENKESEPQPARPRRFIWRDKKGSGKSWEADSTTDRGQ